VHHIICERVILAQRSELRLAIEQDAAKNVRRKVADSISMLAAAFLSAGYPAAAGTLHLT